MIPPSPSTHAPSLPPFVLRVARSLGFAGLGAALALAVTFPEELRADSGWWAAWLSSAALLLFGFPLTMLALWRNADRRPLLDETGRPRSDDRGRPLRRRVERPGSRRLLTSLVLQATGLLLLVGLLLGLVLTG